MLAISISPLMCAVGAAVNFSRINSARTVFEVYLDSNALTGRKPITIRGKAASQIAEIPALSSSPDNYDTNVVPPTTAISATLFATEHYLSCPQAFMELNYDWSAINTLVDNMMPADNINQGIGLAIRLMSLVSGGPFFAPAKDPYVIILLADGMNTQNC